MDNEEILKENRRKIIEAQQKEMVNSFETMIKNLKTLEYNVELLKFKNIVSSYKLKYMFFIGASVVLISIIKNNFLLFFFYAMLFGIQQAVEVFFNYQLTKNKAYVVKLVLMIIIVLLCICRIFTML